MKNNKGFSLIEILATMVILAIVSTVGIVSVNRLIKQSREHFYKSQQQQMVLAAQSYANDNRNILPKNVGGMIKVTLGTLRDKNYLKEDIVDQDKNPCDKDNSYVTIYKSNRSDYKYRGYLECPACRKGNSSTCYTGDQKTKPDIEISFTAFNNDSQGNALFEDNKNITIKMKSLKNPTSNPDIKIASYSYKIFVNNELRFDSGTKIDNKRTEFTITEKVIKYIPGTIKVVATVTNTDGSTTSKTDSYNYNDAHVPLCGRVTYEGQNAMTAYDSQTNPAPTCGQAGYPWMNISTTPNNRLAWVLCNDVKGIGCAQHEFSQSFTTDGHDDKITIRDKNGKSYDCTVKKCIDKTSSSITFSFYVANASGGPSGGPVQTYTASPQRTNFTYVKEESYPNWLNKENYPNGVLIKVKVNDVTSNINTFTWKINPRNQTVSTVTDPTTTIKTKSNLDDNGEVSYLITDDGVRKQEITVVDKAGNTTILKVYMKIDRTPPTCNSVDAHKSVSKDDQTEGTDAYNSNHWSGRAKVYTWPVCTDSISGCYPSWYKVTVSRGTSSSASTGTFTTTKRGLTSQGISYHDWNIQDEAANKTDCTQFIIKLDRTDPKCDYSKTTKNSRAGVGGPITCTDSLSGCRSDNPTSFSGLKADKDYTVYDVVGNHDTCSVNVTSYTMYDCHPTYQDCTTECTEWCFERCAISGCTSDCSSIVPSGAFNTYCNKSKEVCTTKCKSSGSTGWISSSNGCSCSSDTFYK